MKPLWGIDLGGTKIEGVILISPENPEVICRIRIPTEANLGYDHILNQIAKLVNIMSEETSLSPAFIGIGTPGTLDPETEQIKNSNTTSLNGKPFQKDLENIVKIPVALANDANCFALAETRMGIVKEAVPGAQVVFGIIMGTGVGGGIIVNNEIISGKHGIGGEWGHIFLDESGGKCYCGRSGCVETILSGPSLQRYYYSLSGKDLSLKEIAASNEMGTDKLSVQTINRLYEFFGKGIAQVINILDPDAIVLGGGLGNIPSLYTKGVEEVKKYVFNDSLKTPFLKPALGDSAGVFGAAMLGAKQK
jgi:predicted NBD/HSP70 family sugar kinase